MYYIKKYEYCLKLIRKNNSTFNAFDLMKLLEIYFDDINFYPCVCKTLNLYSNYFKIENEILNLGIEFDVYAIHNSIWRFIE